MSNMLNDKPLFIITNNFYNFLLVNLLFMISNIIFLHINFFTSISFNSALVFMVSFIPMGPALGAAFYAMGKLQREKEISPIKDYFRGYRQNFKTSLMFWIPQLIIVYLLFGNYYHITRTGEFSVFILLTIVLLVFVLTLNLYAFPVMVRFEMSAKNLWIISILYFFKHWKITFLNFTTLVSFAIIYFQFPFISLLFLASIIPFLIMMNLRLLLAEIEENGSAF